MLCLPRHLLKGFQAVQHLSEACRVRGCGAIEVHIQVNFLPRIDAVREILDGFKGL